MNKQLSSKRYLRVPEASAEYGISIPLIRKLIWKGRLQTIRPAGARVVLIPREALDDLMNEGK